MSSDTQDVWARLLSQGWDVRKQTLGMHWALGQDVCQQGWDMCEMVKVDVTGLGCT